MHLSITSLSIVLSSLLSGSIAQAGVWTPVDNTWKLTFDEEFNGTSVNTNKWGTNWLGSSGQITKPINSAEIGAYDPAQVSVKNGNLELSAAAKVVKATDGKTYNYVSGIVQSYRKFQQAYGYMEARVYTPGNNGKILNWPGVWMNGDHAAYGKSWPYAGEMDIMEGLSGYAQYHFHSDLTHAGGGPKTDFSGWHIYAAHWEPGLVTYYYDGVKVGQTTSGVTSLPMYFILNYGVSPENQYGGPMQIPATMLVDYVHVYSRDPNAVAVVPEQGYAGPGATGGVDLVDKVAPSTPTNLVASAASTSAINLAWSASSDDVGVVGYTVFRNGNALPNINATKFSDTNLSPSTKYTYEVRAFDKAGNISAKSISASATTMAEVVVPPPPPPPVPVGVAMINPSFESGVTGWKYYGGASVVNAPYNGAYAANIVLRSAFEQVVGGLSPSTTYVITAYLRLDSSSSNIALGVKDFGGSQIAVSASSTSYQKITITFRTGSSNTSAKVFVYGNSGSGKADDFLIQKLQ